MGMLYFPNLTMRRRLGVGGSTWQSEALLSEGVYVEMIGEIEISTRRARAFRTPVFNKR